VDGSCSDPYAQFTARLGQGQLASQHSFDLLVLELRREDPPSIRLPRDRRDRLHRLLLVDEYPPRSASRKQGSEQTSRRASTASLERASRWSARSEGVAGNARHPLRNRARGDRDAHAREVTSQGHDAIVRCRRPEECLPPTVSLPHGYVSNSQELRRSDAAPRPASPVPAIEVLSKYPSVPTENAAPARTR